MLVCAALSAAASWAVERSATTFAPNRIPVASRSRFGNVALSTVHASLSTAAAMRLLTEFDLSSFEQAADSLRVQLCLDLGYYLYDTIMELRRMSHQPRFTVMQAGFIIHHLPPLCGIAFYLFWSMSVPAQRLRAPTAIIAAGMLMHVTTPVQNWRWVLEKTGQKSRLVYRVCVWTLVILLTVVRVYGIVPLLRFVVQLKSLEPQTTIWQVLTEHLPLKCIIGTAIVYPLNVVWWLRNVQNALQMK